MSKEGTSPDRRELGPTIIDGVLQYVSPSAIKRYSPEEGGCPRKWGFRYISKLPDPPKKSTKAGIEGHNRIEHYLKTGEKVLTPIELAGARFIPEPNTVTVERLAAPGKGAPLIDGFPLVTKIDVANNSGKYVDPEGNVRDQDWPEVLDWKFSSDPRRWGKTAAQIADDLAMSAYGVWMHDEIIEARKLRLSHVYFSLKNRDSFKRTAVVPIGDLRRKLESYAPTIRAMRDAARCTDPNELEPNFDACGAFGGCPYQSVCSKTSREALRSLFGGYADPLQTTEEDQKMGLLDDFEVSPPWGEPPQGESMEDAVKRLEAEDQTPPGPGPAEVKAAIEAIHTYGVGFPTLEGSALAAAQASGLKCAPDGKLAAVPISKSSDILELAAELGTKIEAPKAAPAEQASDNFTGAPAGDSLTPPETPPPDRSTAAAPVPEEEAITLPTAAKEAAQDYAKEAAPPKEKKPGRPPAPGAHLKKMKKGEVVEYALELEAKLASGNATDEAIVSADEAASALKAENEKLRDAIKGKTFSAAPIEIWIDALPSNDVPQSLAAYVDEKAAAVAKAGKAPHILAGGNDSPIAFGKWEGILAAVVAEEPPAPGRYFLHCKGDRVREVVARALEKVALVHRGIG